MRVSDQLDSFYLDESEFDTIDRRVFDYTPVGDLVARLTGAADELGVTVRTVLEAE